MLFWKSFHFKKNCCSPIFSRFCWACCWLIAKENCKTWTRENQMVKHKQQQNHRIRNGSTSIRWNSEKSIDERVQETNERLYVISLFIFVAVFHSPAICPSIRQFHIQKKCDDGKKFLMHKEEKKKKHEKWKIGNVAIFAGWISEWRWIIQHLAFSLRQQVFGNNWIVAKLWKSWKIENAKHETWKTQTNFYFRVQGTKIGLWEQNVALLV